MAINNPKPSSWYAERMGTTRSPSTPLAPANLDGRFAYGQNDPGPGALNPGDGLTMAGIFSITVSLWPQAGQTITGGGMLCWLYSPFTQQWGRAPDLDLTIASGTYTGPQGYVFQPMKVLGRLGYLVNFLSSSVTGTTPDFLMRIDGFVSVLGMSA